MRVPGFEIVGRIGRGGMGDVWHAVRVAAGGFRKDVALKQLALDRAVDGKAVQRFLAEARVSARLEHPNIVRVDDLLVLDEGRFIVMELLRGADLADVVRAAGGKLGWREALTVADGVLAGLAHAHATASVVHRDLTPRNVYVCADGTVKILDFGIAKLRETLAPMTRDGIVQGTLEFLSPEQARGAADIDGRSDLYQLGATLYFALTGAPPHRGATPAEVHARALGATPDPIPADIPEAARRVVEKAMSADREARYRDAADMRAAVREALGGAADPQLLVPLVEKVPQAEPAPVPEAPAAREEGARERPPKSNGSALDPTVRAVGLAAAGAQPTAIPPEKRQLRWPLLVAAALALAAVAFVVGRAAAPRQVTPAPAPGPATPALFGPYERLTFRKGPVFNARFTADGKSIIYSADFSGGEGEVETFLAARGESVHRPLGIPGHEILSVGANNELLVLGDATGFGYSRKGTLAEASIAGRAPRARVADAEWAERAPDGSLALVRWEGSHPRLEWPQGTVVFEAADGASFGWIGHPRISPDGTRLAFLEHPTIGDDRGFVTVLHRASGKIERLTDELSTVQGLAWAPDGTEIFFTGGEQPRPLRAVTLDRRVRTIEQGPIPLVLLDVARDGTFLLRADFRESRIMFDGAARLMRDMSIHDFGFPSGLTPDGKTAFIIEGSDESESGYATFMRDTGGKEPPVRLASKMGGSPTPDGKWILAFDKARRDLELLPIGPGDPRDVPVPDVEAFLSASWFPDGRLVLWGKLDNAHRLFVHDPATGDTRVLPPTGLAFTRGGFTSPDGREVLAIEQASERLVRVPLDGGEPRPVAGALPGEGYVFWLDDGSILVSGDETAPRAVFRVNPETGERKPFQKLTPADPAGVLLINEMVFAPNGKSWLFAYYRLLSTLYVVPAPR